jgi:hypothetical protein
MARRKNLLKTTTLTISTTPQIRLRLTQIAKTGLWGKNVAEAAERLLGDGIRGFIRDGILKRPDPNGK